MQHFRTHRGYFFRNWCVSLNFFIKEHRYSIQMRIPGFKGRIGYWMIYNSRKKPRFRHLGIISFLFPAHLAFRISLVTLMAIPNVIGYPVYVFAGLIKAISYLLMLSPYSALHEVKRCFSVWYSDVRDVL